LQNVLQSTIDFDVPFMVQDIVFQFQMI